MEESADPKAVLSRAREAGYATFDKATVNEGPFYREALSEAIDAFMAEIGKELVLVPKRGFAVIVSNNDGGVASYHGTLDDARRWLTDYLTGEDSDPPFSEWPEDQQKETMRDLAELTGEYVESVRGSQAWKEWAYVAPVDLAMIEAASGVAGEEGMEG
jgi:hypothetical protein